MTGPRLAPLRPDDRPAFRPIWTLSDRVMGCHLDSLARDPGKQGPGRYGAAREVA